MVEDLQRLLDAVPEGGRQAYHHAIVEDNLLLKKTTRTRKVSWKYLQRLYGFDDPAYTRLNRLYHAHPGALPLLALLIGLTRDHIMHATAEFILPQPYGSVVDLPSLKAWMSQYWGDTRTETSRHAIAQRVLSSWAQSGHLKGIKTKRRIRVAPSPEAVAFALYLGHQEGARGLLLYQTVYARALDASEGELDELAYQASTLGQLKYRRIADVLEITFPEP